MINAERYDIHVDDQGNHVKTPVPFHCCRCEEQAIYGITEAGSDHWYCSEHWQERVAERGKVWG